MENENAEKAPVFTSEDAQKVQELLKTLEDLKRQIAEKLQSKQNRTGFSLKQLEEFYNDKKNFSEEKWQKLLSEKANFQKEFKEFFDYKPMTKVKVDSKVGKKAKKWGKRTRRHSNWLEM